MKIAIIGAGNMGGSIARGLAKGSLIDDSDIIVSNPNAGKLEKLKKEFPGISITKDTGSPVTLLKASAIPVAPPVMRPEGIKNNTTVSAYIALPNTMDSASFFVSQYVPHY